MSARNFLCIEGKDQLLAHRDAWDDLWQRSDLALPTLQAELLAAWLDHFAANSRFQAWVVEEEGRFLAALPLVDRRLKGLLTVADVTGNEWAGGGDFLLDENTEDAAGVVDLLLGGMRQMPWPLLWLDSIELDAARWELLSRRAVALGLAADTHPHYEVARVDTRSEWETYEQNLSKSLRRNMRRRKKQLGEQGEIACVARKPRPENLEADLRKVFAVEDRSWKGQAGSTILQTPGMFDYYLRQSELLLERDELAIYVLTLDEQPIAFEYGYFAKGVYFAHKVSFDESYAYFAPGQLLRVLQLEQMFRDSRHHAIDYMGEVTSAVEKWETGRYRVGRLVISSPRILGRSLMWGYQNVAPVVRQLRS